jgi:hypothetical protein
VYHNPDLLFLLLHSPSPVETPSNWTVV